MWLQYILHLLAVTGIVAGFLLVCLLAHGARTHCCPYCARGNAIFPRGRDLVCWGCWRAIGRRIRSLERPDKLRIVK